MPCTSTFNAPLRINNVVLIHYIPAHLPSCMPNKVDVTTLFLCNKIITEAGRHLINRTLKDLNNASHLDWRISEGALRTSPRNLSGCQECLHLGILPSI